MAHSAMGAPSFSGTRQALRWRRVETMEDLLSWLRATVAPKENKRAEVKLNSRNELFVVSL